MALPRPVHAGSYVFVSRRCTQRQYLLRPDAVTNNAFWYCLAEAAARHGVGVVGVLVMSNHYHAVYWDPHGRLPAFLEHLHKMLARVMNARWGRHENLWATEQTCVIRCVRAEDAFDRLVYALTNPVKDQLVDKVACWPGASSLRPQLLDKAVTARRPRHYFRRHGRMPEQVQLRFVRPAGYARLSHEAWAAKLRGAVTRAEAAAAEQRAARGGRVMGRKAVLRQSPHDAPRSTGTRGNRRRRVACRSRRHRLEALRRDRQFLERYAAALARLRAGIREVVFPAGTYLLRVRGLVRCAPMLEPG